MNYGSVKRASFIGRLSQIEKKNENAGQSFVNFRIPYSSLTKSN